MVSPMEDSTQRWERYRNGSAEAERVNMLQRGKDQRFEFHFNLHKIGHRFSQKNTE